MDSNSQQWYLAGPSLRERFLRPEGALVAGWVRLAERNLTKTVGQGSPNRWTGQATGIVGRHQRLRGRYRFSDARAGPNSGAGLLGDYWPVQGSKPQLRGVGSGLA